MARERTTWMKIAPHLIHPLTCLMPTTQKISRSRLAMGVALMANDILSFDRNLLVDPEKDLLDGMLVSQRELSRILPGYDVSTSTGARFGTTLRYIIQRGCFWSSFFQQWRRAQKLPIMLKRSAFCAG